MAYCERCCKVFPKCFNCDHAYVNYMNSVNHRGECTKKFGGYICSICGYNWVDEKIKRVQHKTTTETNVYPDTGISHSHSSAQGKSNCAYCGKQYGKEAMLKHMQICKSRPFDPEEALTEKKVQPVHVLAESTLPKQMKSDTTIEPPVRTNVPILSVGEIEGELHFPDIGEVVGDFKLELPKNDLGKKMLSVINVENSKLQDEKVQKNDEVSKLEERIENVGELAFIRRDDVKELLTLVTPSEKNGIIDKMDKAVIENEKKISMANEIIGVVEKKQEILEDVAKSIKNNSGDDKDEKVNVSIHFNGPTPSQFVEIINKGISDNNMAPIVGLVATSAIKNLIDEPAPHNIEVSIEKKDIPVHKNEQKVVFDVNEKVKCSICSKQIVYKNLGRHIIKVHDIKSGSPKKYAIKISK
jgi:hypothetical protein